VSVGGLADVAPEVTAVAVEHVALASSEIVAAWDDLADRVQAPPFLRPAWFDLLRRAFGPQETSLLVATRAGRLVGVMPLEDRGSTLASLANDHTPLFGPVAEDEAALAALARALFETRRSHVRVEYLDADAGGVGALVEAARATGYLVAVRDWERPPYVALDGSWEDYERRLDGKLRRDLARRRRRLDEAGVVDVDVDDGRGDLARLLREGFALEASGWKDARGTAIASQPATLAFYTGLAEWAAARGILRLAFLRLDGRPLAFQFGLEDAGAYYFVKGGYDLEYTPFAPAKLLVRSLLMRAFAADLRRFEFLGSPEPFKLEWTSTCRDLKAVEAFGRTPAGVTRWLGTVYGRPVARRVAKAAHRPGRPTSKPRPKAWTSSAGGTSGAALGWLGSLRKAGPSCVERQQAASSGTAADAGRQ
jgi:CelD/BcsL family acetyltransferase involved in cellulose biosynthesis